MSIQEKEHILGLDVCVDNYENLIHDISQRIRQKNKTTIVAVNPEKVLKAREDKALQSLINSFTVQIPDGTGIIWASKKQQGNIKERVTGIDMMSQLCQLAAKEGFTLFLYGAAPGRADEAARALEQQYPGIKIVGTLDGYVKNQEQIITTINEKKPNILFVALGSPKQELWIQENIHKLDVDVFQGVGGSYDVISGNIKRAPEFMQKAGLEWLHRFLKQPSRYKRYVKLFSFVTLLYKEKK